MDVKTCAHQLRNRLKSKLSIMPHDINGGANVSQMAGGSKVYHCN